MFNIINEKLADEVKMHPRWHLTCYFSFQVLTFLTMFFFYTSPCSPCWSFPMPQRPQHTFSGHILKLHNIMRSWSTNEGNDWFFQLQEYLTLSHCPIYYAFIWYIKCYSELFSLKYKHIIDISLNPLPIKGFWIERILPNIKKKYSYTHKENF